MNKFKREYLTALADGLRIIITAPIAAIALCYVLSCIVFAPIIIPIMIGLNHGLLWFFVWMLLLCVVLPGILWILTVFIGEADDYLPYSMSFWLMVVLTLCSIHIYKVSGFF